MIHSENTWRTPDNVSLYTQEWLPDSQPRGCIILVHGVGEHCGRYRHVAEYFAHAGYAFFGFDLRGHGRSEGKRGHIASYAVISDDTQQLVDVVRRRYPQIPIFVYGHSLGGAMVLNYLLTRHPNIQGALVTSPGLAPGTPVPGAKMALARIMAALAPSFTLANGLDLDNLSHDREYVKEYKSDPLNHELISAGLGMQLMDRGTWILTQSELPVPVLLIQGTADHLVDPLATRRFANNIHANLTYKEWQDGYHELHNEPEKLEVFALMLAWLDQQVTAQVA